MGSAFDTRTDARRGLIITRLGSGLLTGGSLAAVTLLFDTSVLVLAILGAIAIGFLLAMTPVGNLLWVFTAWTGYAVVSCPYCPHAHLRRVQVCEAECVQCGVEKYNITVGNRIPGWTYRSTDDGQVAFCSWVCLEAWDDGGDQR